MSVKAMDKKNRWRNKTVAFRVSPEEWVEIERLVALSGMSKQQYIMQRLQNIEMVIQANPRVLKAIKTEVKSIATQLEEVNLEGDSSVIERVAYLMGSIKNIVSV